jgi:hypothetical protein
VVAWSTPAGAARRVSGTAGTVALPLSVAIGVAMLALGRGPVVGLLERLLLANVVGWAVALAVIIAAGHRQPTRAAFPAGP